MVDAFEGLNDLDRELLLSRMAEELPKIRKKVGVSVADLAEKVGIDQDRLTQTESGGRSLEWSEYMSILFVLWNNDIARGIVEAEGLFPEALKRAMSVNRNVHAPAAESGRYER